MVVPRALCAWALIIRPRLVLLQVERANTWRVALIDLVDDVAFDVVYLEGAAVLPVQWNLGIVPFAV